MSEMSFNTICIGCKAPTPVKSFHKVRLESSSTGFSFPADSAKLVPLVVVLLNNRQGRYISHRYSNYKETIELGLYHKLIIHCSYRLELCRILVML